MAFGIILALSITVQYFVPTLRTVMDVPHLFSQEGMTMCAMARSSHTVPERTNWRAVSRTTRILPSYSVAPRIGAGKPTIYT